MEEPVQFNCKNKRLYGILHIPDSVSSFSTVVIIITGGPQIRSGSHRLYVQLSRYLCKKGWASLRFDYEGLGDSEGDFVGFRYAEDSISSAIIFLQSKYNHQLNFVFWALCDGATAAALYGATKPKDLQGMILCNPLTLTTQGLARSTIKHYYGKRLFKKDFLHKLISFKLDLSCTIKELWNTILKARFIKQNDSNADYSTEKNFPQKVFNSLHKFDNPIRIILSTDDIVASNFKDEWKRIHAAQKNLGDENIVTSFIKGADHTFVDPGAKEKLFQITLQALNEINYDGPKAHSVP